MRTLLALLIFGFSASAHATLIQYDLQGFSPTSRVDDVKISLLLDTAGGSAEFRERVDADSNPLGCYSFFSLAGLSGKIQSFSFDGAPVFGDIVGITGMASVGGNFRDTGCDGDPQQPAAANITISADTFQFDFLLKTGFVLPPPDVLRATPDQVTTVLLSQAQGLAEGFIDLRTSNRQVSIGVQDLSIREVPEPPSYLLLLLGLTGLVIGRRAQRRPTPTIDRYE